MVRFPMRVVRAMVAVGGLVALAGACGGSSTAKTFTLPVQEGDTVGTLYTRAITTAVQYCVDNSKLQQVSWRFGKDDIDKPVVQQYTNPNQQPGPMSIPCDQVRGQNIDPSKLTTTTQAGPSSTETTEEEGPSSQQQDEGGKGATGSSSTTPAAGGGAGSTSTPASSTSTKP